MATEAGRLATQAPPPRSLVARRRRAGYAPLDITRLQKKRGREIVKRAVLRGRKTDPQKEQELFEEEIFPEEAAAGVTSAPWEVCFRVASNAAELFKNHVCISYTAWDLEHQLVPMRSLATGSWAVHPGSGVPIYRSIMKINPNGLLGTPTAIKRICNLKQKPVAITVDVIRAAAPPQIPEDSAHRMVAIYWPAEAVFEFWDSGGKAESEQERQLREIWTDTLTTYLQPQAPPGKLVTFVDTSPEENLQQEIGTELRRIEEAYCQTWAFFWVFARTVVKCNADSVNKWLLGMSKNERFQMIDEFHRTLRSNRFPEHTKSLLLEQCELYQSPHYDGHKRSGLRYRVNSRPSSGGKRHTRKKYGPGIKTSIRPGRQQKTRS